MREQRQISPRSLPHSFSSNCCGSETARNATWLRYQAGKRQVNVRGAACEQAVIPFPPGNSWANTRRIIEGTLFPSLLRFWASGRAAGASDGDSVAAIQPGQRISFNDAKQVGIVGASAGARAWGGPHYYARSLGECRGGAHSW